MFTLGFIKYVLVIVNTLLELGWSGIVVYDSRRGHRAKRGRLIAAYIGLITGPVLLVFLALHRPF